jgi:hypothetical protein
MHEGLAQYTGIALSGQSPAQNRLRAAEDLETAESANSFVRSFAYPLGGAYGLLLDVYRPGWTEAATPGTDLADMLPFEAVAATPATARYHGESLATSEDAREAKRIARLESQLHRYVTGPRLVLPFQNMNVTFDPGEVDVLAGHGSVYSAMDVTDVWGKLEVTAGGLIRDDWSAAVVPAPEGRAGVVVGSGFTLTLNEGWVVAETEDQDTLTVREDG